nr:hypothetical protein [Tanacetum cinerariifolium]
VSAAATTVTIDDITLAKVLKALKTSKPKIRGIVLKDHEEQSESRTTTIYSKKSQDKRYKLNSLKNKSFADLQDLFDKEMKRVNTFVDYINELMEESSKKVEAEITQEESSKRAGNELEQETAKKQKIVDDKEIANLKQLVKIIPKEDIAYDDLPLVVKTLIVD